MVQGEQVAVIMKKIISLSFSPLLLFPFSLFLLASCSTSQLFYYPYKEITKTPDTSKVRYEEINFQASDSSSLNGWFMKPKKDSAVVATVLFLHGNAGNIGYQYGFLVPLVKAGFQCMVFDYEGFGRSQGSPSQEKVLDDGITALNYIRSRKDVQGTKLILYGQSLGGNLAPVVASRCKGQIDALIIEGAFTNHKKIAGNIGWRKFLIPAFFTRPFIPTRYNSIDCIGNIDVPVLVIHSTEDKVCPCFMGKQLYTRAASPKEYWEIKGGHVQCSALYPDEFVKRFKNIIGK